MFATALTMALWPLCDTADSFYCFGFFFGLFSGGFIALSPVIAGDMWGVANLGGTFALLNICQVPGALASGPVAGAIQQAAGSYNPAIWMGSAFIFLCFFCLACVRKEPTPAEAENAPEEDVKDEENGNAAAAPTAATTANNSQQSLVASSISKPDEEVEKEQKLVQV